MRKCGSSLNSDNNDCEVSHVVQFTLSIIYSISAYIVCHLLSSNAKVLIAKNNKLISILGFFNLSYIVDTS